MINLNVFIFIYEISYMYNINSIYNNGISGTAGKTALTTAAAGVSTKVGTLSAASIASKGVLSKLG